MIRASGTLLLALIAVESAELSAVEHYTIGRQDVAIGLIYEPLASGDFRLGSERFDWDHGDRTALTLRTRINGLQQVETVGGIDLYGDWREGDTPHGTLKDRSLGFDLQCALAVHLADDPRQAAVDLSLAPFIRAGIARHELSIDDVQTNQVRIVDEVPGIRYAAAVGADARLVLGRRFEASLGAGLQLWTSGTLTVNGYSGSGSTPTSQSATYSGQETFIRMAVMIWLGS
jgi:hypothetical protein